MKGQSLLALLNLPSGFGELLLGVAFVLALVPYAAGMDLGAVRIPDLGEKARRRLKSLGPVIFLATVLLHVPLFEPAQAAGCNRLEGKWQLTDRVDASSMSSYIGDEHRFDLWLSLDGSRVVGRAEKISYNGRNLPREERSQLEISGTVTGRDLKATFSELGPRRRSTGRFTWQLAEDCRSFHSAFESTAGDTRGISAGTWLHE